MSFSEWKEAKLGEVCDIVMGQSPKGENCNNVGNGTPLLNGPTEFGLFNPHAIQFTTDVKKQCIKGDLLFCVRGSTTGRMNWADKEYAIGRGLATIRHKAGTDYNYFVKGLIDYKLDEILNCATGSTFPNVGKDLINSLLVYIPPLQEQKAIADTLSCLDDKIELNNRINKTLEEMAQAIFKSWFVDFEIFQEGEFEESELGMIPKGWRVGTLGEVLSQIEAGNRPKGGVGSLDTGIPSIGAENIIGLGKYDFSKEKYVSQDYYESMNKGIIKKWDVLLYKDGAQLGRKTMFAQDFPHKKCCVNSHVFILRSNDLITQPYLYFWLDQDTMTQNIINLNTNSAQPGINQPAVKQLKILIPDKYTVYEFQKIIEKLMNKLFENCKENQILTTTRDSLLPRLMSGALRVSIDEVK